MRSSGTWTPWNRRPPSAPSGSRRSADPRPSGVRNNRELICSEYPAMKAVMAIVAGAYRLVPGCDHPTTRNYRLTRDTSTIDWADSARQRRTVPPSMLITCPLIPEPSSDSRKAPRAATSSPSPPPTTNTPQRAGLKLRPLWGRADRLGRGEPRSDCVAPDPVLAPSRSHVSSQRPDPGLRGGVSRPCRLTLERRRRGHVDDGAASARNDLGNRVFHRCGKTTEIDCHHAVPYVKVEVDDVGVGLECAHVRADRKQKVHTAEEVISGVHERRDRIRIG